jgi:hypothetical protein
MKFLFSTIFFVSFIRFGAVAFGQLGATPVPVRALTPHPTSVPVVVSVDADTITVQNGIFAGGKVTHHEADAQKNKGPANVRTYAVRPWTEITINGHRSKLSDIKAGMPVRITAGTTPTDAYSIAAKVDRSVLIPVP